MRDCVPLKVNKFRSYYVEVKTEVFIFNIEYTRSQVFPKLFYVILGKLLTMLVVTIQKKTLNERDKDIMLVIC